MDDTSKTTVACDFLNIRSPAVAADANFITETLIESEAGRRFELKGLLFMVAFSAVSSIVQTATLTNYVDDTKVMQTVMQISDVNLPH